MSGTNHCGGNGSRGHTVLLVPLHHRHAARNAPGVQIVTGATLLAGGGKAGLYIPQPQGANGNTKGRQLAAQGAGQAFHRRLGGRVKALERNGKHRCGGGNIENTPPTLSQGRQGRLNHRDPCKKIQIELAAHFCLPGAFHRAGNTEPGVIHQQVYPVNGRKGRLHLGAVRYIAWNAAHPLQRAGMAA